MLDTSKYEYNPETGVVLRRFYSKRKGLRIKTVGSIHKHGYLQCRINGKHWKVHRLAWYLYYGELPKGDIDHINHDRTDNRICNLRDVTKKENGRNQSKPKRNTSGAVGVYMQKDRNRWYASIRVDGKNIFLGSFVEYHEAVNARKNAEVLYGFHENHGE